MKTLMMLLFAITMFWSFPANVHAQKKDNKLKVTTRLKETNGSYEQRKIYRTLLTEAMKECPYVSNFHIYEMKNASDNHKVIWSYQVSGWDDITNFYNWIDNKLNHSKDAMMVAALTPYKPDYDIGGEIAVKEKTKDAIAAK